MTREFYDGNIRPNRFGGWSRIELDRICLNCSERFGVHRGYKCPPEMKE